MYECGSKCAWYPGGWGVFSDLWKLELQMLSATKLVLGLWRLTGAHYCWTTLQSPGSPLISHPWASVLVWLILLKLPLYLGKDGGITDKASFVVVVLFCSLAQAVLHFTIWLKMILNWSSCLQVLNSGDTNMALAGVLKSVLAEDSGYAG